MRGHDIGLKKEKIKEEKVDAELKKLLSISEKINLIPEKSKFT